MKGFLAALFFLLLSVPAACQSADLSEVIRLTTPNGQDLPCIAFSPYVDGFNPNFGPHPPPDLLAALLDRLVATGRVKCILIYSLNWPLSEVPRLARDRGLKVIANVWLDENANINTGSINQGISVLRQFPNTIIAVSCGSEVWLRNDKALADREIGRCIDAVRAANLPQPITHIATWIEWCKFTYPLCPPWDLADRLDFLSSTAYAWWENRIGRFGCVGPERAGQYHIDRLRDNQNAYPGKLIVLAEFSWPGGPEGFVDRAAVGPCSVAGRDQQRRAASDTLRLLRDSNRQGILFSAFNEPWKGETEGRFAAFWGFCSGQLPYNCDLPPIGGTNIPPPSPPPPDTSCTPFSQTIPAHGTVSGRYCLRSVGGRDGYNVSVSYPGSITVEYTDCAGATESHGQGRAWAVVPRIGNMDVAAFRVNYVGYALGDWLPQPCGSAPPPSPPPSPPPPPNTCVDFTESVPPQGRVTGRYCPVSVGGKRGYDIRTDFAGAITVEYSDCARTESYGANENSVVVPRTPSMDVVRFRVNYVGHKLGVWRGGSC